MRLLLFNLVTDADDPVLGFTTGWIKSLADQVEKIDVMTMRTGRVEVPENVCVYSVGKEKGYSELRRAFEFYRLLFNLLHYHTYDACFAHMMPLFVVMAAPFLRIKHIPVVLWYAHRSVTLTLHLATLLVDRIVTSIKEGFRIRSNKVRIIGQGIETERFVPGERSVVASESTFTILTVGRLSPIKRVDLLIEAVALLRQRMPELSVCVKIVGGTARAKDQAHVAELRRRIEHYGLQEVVVFEGSVPFSKVVTYYQRTDCFVNVCPTGAIDKAVLEAMSCGVIPIVVNRSFVDVLGEDLATTYITDADPEQVADRLVLLVSMPKSERWKIGEQLREIVVRDHSLSTLCSKVLREIEELV